MYTNCQLWYHKHRQSYFVFINNRHYTMAISTLIILKQNSQKDGSRPPGPTGDIYEGVYGLSYGHIKFFLKRWPFVRPQIVTICCSITKGYNLFCAYFSDSGWIIFSQIPKIMAELQGQECSLLLQWPIKNVIPFKKYSKMNSTQKIKPITISYTQKGRHCKNYLFQHWPNA